MSAAQKGEPSKINLDDIKHAAELLGIARIGLERVRRSINTASQWLLQISDSGTWGWWSHFDPKDLHGNIIKIWSTAMSLKALLRAEVSPENTQIAEGIRWLIENRVPDKNPCWAVLPQTYKEERYKKWLSPNTYETSCTLLTLQEAKNVVSFDKRIIKDGIQNLMRYQRKDGYWPIFLTQEISSQPDSNVGATNLALIAISRVRKDGIAISGMQNVITKAANWVISQQRESCGAWGEAGDLKGSTAKTSDAIRALIESDVGKWRNAVDDGVTWLLENQGVSEDGRGWGWRKTYQEKLIASTVESTAFGIIALLRAGKPPGLASIQTGLRWLLDRQRQGNWGPDTPRAILALCQYVKAVS